MVHILIVEDSRVSRESFERQLEAVPGFQVTACIENAANAEIVCMRQPIGLILMDICTADDESGLEAAARIKAQYPLIKIVMMTSMPEYSFIEKARASGCDSFWYKEWSDVSLTDICRDTLDGQSIWPDQTPSVRIGAIRSDEFTLRELEVIRALAAGGRYEEIAAQLAISTNTVKYHLKNILQKTGLRSALDLVAEVVGKRLALPKF